jgi:molybdate transport system substrate-binding protein
MGGLTSACAENVMLTRSAIVIVTGIAIFCSFSSTTVTHAAEIKVLSVNGVKLVLPDLVSNFEQNSQHKVAVSLGEAGVLRKRIEGGEAFDVAILPRPATDALMQQTKIAAGSPVDVVRAAFGIGTRSGAPKPDTSSLDAFKRSLLAAKSIVYTDPATGGVTGVFFARVLDELSITNEIKQKSRLTSGVLNAEFVARGEAEVAFQMRHEILAVPGIEFVPLPSEYQKNGVVIFTASVSANAKERDAADAFVQFLSGPVAIPLIKAKGMEPG